MDAVAAARREVALDIQRLAEEFERSDAAAFRRTRLACWVVTGLVTVLALILLVMGGDRRYLGFFWVAIVGLTWAGYAFSRCYGASGADQAPSPLEASTERPMPQRNDL